MSAIPRPHQIQLFLQMQMLLSSGVLIADALGRLKERYPDVRTRRVLRDVHAQVAESRMTLSQALERFPRSFPPSVVASVRAGEEGGALLLAERFGDLAERLAYENGARRQLRRACAYPIFVILMASGVYLLMLGLVFPRLAELLGSLGGRLPPLTRSVIALSVFVRRAWPAIIALPIAGIFLAAGLRRIPAAALRLDRLFLRLPLIGAVYQNLAVALICKIFRSLYRANQPAPQIMDLCIQLVDNRAFRHGLAEIKRRVTTEGATLAEAFAQSGLFPPLACLAIDVGEQSGQIAQAMDRVAEHLRTQARIRLDAMIAVINPALTLLVVGGVGVMLISFFEAIYQVVYVSH
jgi:type IV pilus assembly protein PilC